MYQRTSLIEKEKKEDFLVILSNILILIKFDQTLEYYGEFCPHLTLIKFDQTLEYHWDSTISVNTKTQPLFYPKLDFDPDSLF